MKRSRRAYPFEKTVCDTHELTDKTQSMLSRSLKVKGNNACGICHVILHEVHGIRKIRCWKFGPYLGGTGSQRQKPSHETVLPIKNLTGSARFGRHKQKCEILRSLRKDQRSP
jgi:hypothetical protein